MAPFVVASACVRNRCSIDAIKHDARSHVVGLDHVPIPAKRKHDVLLRAVRDVRGGGDDAAADNGYEKNLADTHADNSSISDNDGESDKLLHNSLPIGTSTSSSPTSSTTTTDEANSIIASFEEELVRIRLQIEAEAERQWEMWRKQMLERRRVRKRLLQINLQKEEEWEKERQEEEEKVEAEPEVCAETDTSTSTNADQYDVESTESPFVDESEETALESDIILLDDDEEKKMEEEKEVEEESITSSSVQDTDVVDEVTPMRDEDGNTANLEDSSQIQDDVDSKDDNESGYEEQTTMDNYSEEPFGIQGDIDDGEENDSDAQEDIGFIGDYDAPTDSDDELSGHEEDEAFQDEFEQKDLADDSEGSDAATSNMKVESDDVDDLNVPVERQVNKLDELACNIPKKRRKQKKKKKKKRKKSQRETAQAEERSDDTGRTSLIQTDVALAPTKENSSALRPPSFTRKVVFYVGFAAFLSLFKMILDALVRMGLQ